MFLIHEEIKETNTKKTYYVSDFISDQPESDMIRYSKI